MAVIGLSSSKITVSGGINPAPSVNIIQSTAYLANGGNKSMAVNGSSIPQVFEAEVPTGQTWYVTGISFYFADNEIKKRNQYGDISELNNGLLTEFEISSTDYQHSNIQNNMEVGLIFTKTNDGGDDNNRLASDKPAYFGQTKFDIPVCLQAGDKIKSTVRDDLSKLDDQRMSVTYWRVL